MELIKTEILTGDCLELLTDFPDNFFNLIVISPPYADRRNKTYGGIKPDEYVEWFLPRSAEFLRVLKPDGTFILNIYLCTLLKYLLHHVVPDVLSNGPEMHSGSDPEMIGFQRLSQSVVG